MTLAPCIAVIGPANAGKTTLLHQLDEKLQKRSAAALVIKGTPDNIGRYQFHAPNLREELKGHVKGKWGSSTIEHIRESIQCGRRNLELALLDFGGKHAPDNDQMLTLCSHYIVVSRLLDDEGIVSWEEVAERNGLKRVATVHSIGSEDLDGPMITLSPNGWVGTFRYDVGPEDTANDAVIDRLVEEIVTLRRNPDLIPYVDLHENERWDEAHISDVRGRAAKIREASSRTGVVVLGGRGPIWAYVAALHCALVAYRNARVFFFDPKQPERLVEIPSEQKDGPFPAGVLEIRWTTQEDVQRLEFHMLSEDKFLPPVVVQQLAYAPSFGTLPEHEVCLWGMGPTWLYGAYARWLFGAGVERLSVYDLSTQKAVSIW